MAANFLRLRLIQLAREIEALGIFRALLCLGLLFAAGFGFYRQMQSYPNRIYAIALAMLVILTIQIRRNDKKFISTMVTCPTLIYFSEYLFFSLPLLIIVIAAARWSYAIPYLLLCILISLISYRHKPKAGIINLSGIVPADAFEWIAGIRKHSWYILPLYLCAIALVFVKFASLFLLIMVLSAIASFYQECEPLNILQVKELSAKRFIWKKLKSHVKLYLLSAAPIIAGYCLFNPETAWVAMLIFILSTINLCFFILSKYALYQPGIKLTSNSVATGIALISMFIPFLLPLPLIMCLRDYNRALSNLDHYLNAYN